ncbi:MAG: FAD-binding protein [Pseudomonadota bacterium]
MAFPEDQFLTRKPGGAWTNHHGTVAVTAKARWQIVNENQGAPSLAGMKATAERLQRLIQHATAQNMRLRPMGSRWSFSEVSAPDNAWALETQRLNYRFPVGKGSLDPAYKGTPADLYFVQAGTSIAEINADLEAKSGGLRALRTSGASNGQTIAGALGTGTHGSAIDSGAMESQVLGIQLLTGAKNLWIEHPDHPAMTAAFAAKLGAELKRDAKLFSAALVSLGALGVVHSVLLSVVPRYRLRSFLKRMPMAQILPAMKTLDFRGVALPIPDKRPYFFQVVIDPANPLNGHVTTRYREDCPADYVTDNAQKSGYEVGNDLPGFFGKLLEVAPALRPAVVSAALISQLSPFDDKIGTPAETYTYTQSQAGTAGASIAVPAARVDEALREAVDVFKTVPDAPAAFACRFAQASPAMLGWTRFAPSCMMDIDGIHTPAIGKLMAAVRTRFDAKGIPHCAHWGKLHDLTAARVQSSYGDRLPDWHKVRETLMPDPKERAVFATDLLQRIGITR